MQKKTFGSGNKKSKKNFLPLAAIMVVAAAAVVTLAPRFLAKDIKPVTEENVQQAAYGEDIVIDVSALGEAASFFDYDAGGVTVELFAVKASDGTPRLALNTCQVCNGSPYAFFVQDGDAFICQNCKNRFTSTQVGVVSGGCNPIPITETDYALRDGSIVVSSELLDGFSDRFINWKKLQAA